MLGTNLISKNCFWKSCVGERGLKLIFSDFKRCKKIRNESSSNFHSKKLNLWPYKQLLVNKLSNAEICSSYRYNSLRATVVPKNENHPQTKSYFQEMLRARKMQAHQSILIEIAEKEDIPFAIGYFEKYGSITNIFTYSGESKNCFLLLEYSDEIAAQKVLSNCGFQNIDDVFPVCSRIIRYEKKSNAKLPEVNFNITEDNNSESSLKRGVDISDIIEDIYSSEKLTELDTRLRFLLCALIKDSVSGLLPHCDAVPFGSSVNGIGRHGCDLDIMIRLYPEKVNGDGEVFFLNRTCIGKHKNLQQRTLSRLGEYFLFSPGVSLSDKIMFARVPILKMKHTILKLDFDVSVNNMSAVLMSDIIHFCGEVDTRVRPLMHAVKRWAKEANITYDKPGSQISNFGLANLVLFFLQTRKSQPILPPFNDAVAIIGAENTYNFGLQYLKSLEDWKTQASLNKESLAVLLKEFLLFLTTYPFHENVISLMSAETRTRDGDSTPLYVEYVLDESLNVTKNVSKAEYDNMCEKAKISAKFLENNLKQNIGVKDFSTLLGIPSVSRIGLKKKFALDSVLDNEKTSKNRMKHRV